jgi:hypothetical protein
MEKEASVDQLLRVDREEWIEQHHKKPEKRISFYQGEE